MDNTPSTDETAIGHRIDLYTPTVLPARIWHHSGNDVRSIVASTGPRSVEDAKSLLVTLTKFVAWLHQQDRPLRPLSDQLDEPSIDAYVAQIKTNLAPKTCENELGRLRRIHRSINHLPEPAPASPRPQRAAPYSDDEIALLRGVGSADLALALDLALDDGIVIPAAYQHRPGLSRYQWSAARRAARTAGIGLTSFRLRSTWVHRQARQACPVTELIAQGMTVGDLDAIARSMPRPDLTQLSLAR